MDTVARAASQCTWRDGMARLDEAAFASFYGRTSRPLWSYVYRVTGHGPDADDIVQEAFLRLLRTGPEGGEEEWRRYIYRVASNLVIDRWRSRSRRGDDHPPDPAAPLDPERDADVARTFATLTPRERALLWLAYVEGETHQEIAASLGVRRGSVKVLLFRARRRLRDLLKARGFLAKV
jgi:RNA polymerase sigma-70 factor (ECF subfamily)